MIRYSPHDEKVSHGHLGALDGIWINPHFLAREVDPSACDNRCPFLFGWPGPRAAQPPVPHASDFRGLELSERRPVSGVVVACFLFFDVFFFGGGGCILRQDPGNQPPTP